LRLRTVSTWEELSRRQIAPDALHCCAVLVKRLPAAPAPVLDLVATLMPWFRVWKDHPFWRNGVWVCRIDQDVSSFTSQRQGFLAFHTDMSRYLHPPAFTVIRCVRPDGEKGGANLLIHIDDALRRLEALGRDDILRLLHEPRVLNLADGGRPLVPLAPRHDPRGVSRVFDHHAADKASHLQLAEDEGELFDEFIRLCASWTDLHVRVALAEGELLVFSNHRFLHARAECWANGRTTEVCLGNA